MAMTLTADNMDRVVLSFIRIFIYHLSE